MNNLMLGASGGGKSYETCVYFILPALKRGRKVITNMPLNLPAWGALDDSYLDLIELRTVSKGPDVAYRKDGKPINGREKPEDLLWRKAHAFGHVDDYGDTWRNDKGQGVLYVIDEAHKPLPKIGCSLQVEEWFAEHRHENCDTHLITQSVGKLSQAVAGNIQMVYKCRKAVALGWTTKYIRKVYDGVRGAEMSAQVREYKKQYFNLYKSHTRGVSAEEWGADQVRPIWRHWGFVGGAICMVLALSVFVFSNASIMPTPKLDAAAEARKKFLAEVKARSATPQSPPSAASAVPVAAVGPGRAGSVPAKEPPPPKIEDPLNRHGLHFTGALVQGKRALVTFTASQSGFPIFTITGDELVALGYDVEVMANCVAVLHYKGLRRLATCDLPQQAPTAPTLANGQAPATTSTTRGNMPEAIGVGGAPQGGAPAPVPKAATTGSPVTHTGPLT